MPVEKCFSDKAFNTIIRSIKRGSIGNAAEFKTATFYVMKRLGVKRNTAKVIKGKIPDGSDQIDIGSFVSWANKVLLTDRKAVRQIIAIDATACIRIGG